MSGRSLRWLCIGVAFASGIGGFAQQCNGLATADARSTTALPDGLHYVNLFIGTAKSDVFTRWGNEGGTYPGAVAPWGYMQLTPETKRGEARGYDFHDSLIYIFSCTQHSSGFPNGSAGRFYVMPVRGGALAGRPFLHDREVAEPGYYSVTLGDDGTRIEAVATVRAGVFRIRFPDGEVPEIFIGDTASSAFNFSESYLARRPAEGGTIYTFAGTPGEKTIAAIPGGRNIAANPGGRTILVRVSSATTGAASAKRNIDKECRSGFDTLRAAVRQQWRKVLSVVDIEDPNEANKTVFYTALYHSLLVPWVVSDVDGYYRGADGKEHQVKGRNEYGNFSPWDSYRSLHPLLSLLHPGRQSEMLLSMLDQYRESGHLPVESMTGNHSIPIIVDAYLKGIRGIDKTETYKAMVRNIVRGPFIQADRQVYGEKGYIPLTYPESVTRTVEYGYDDWALAQYAQQVMRDTTMAAMLLQRSNAYRQLLHTPSLLLLPKEGDSFRLRPGNSGYKEGDAWVYTYFAPQDAGGLIDRMGGDAYFSARLDSALQDGRIVFDNETVLHLPYFFNEAGRHDLTRQWVLRLMNKRYSDQPGGLPGNDDLGAMSSWYAFSALGFFPFSPGRAAYEIGAPLFRKAVIHLDDGKQLVIRRSDRTSGLTLNGRPYTATILPHQLIKSGGQLVFGDDVTLTAEQRSKPVFALSDANLSKDRVLPGEMNWVRFSLANSGATGVSRLALLANGREVESRNYYVGAHQERIDSIAFRLYRAGTTKLTLGNNGAGPSNPALGNNSAGTIQVVPPPGALPAEPEVMRIDMRVMVRGDDQQAMVRGDDHQATMTPVDSPRVSYTIKNTGWERQVFHLPLRVDGELVGVDSVGLDAGEERTRSLAWKAGHPGWHELRIGEKVQRFKIYRIAEEAQVLDLDSTLNDRSGFENKAEIVGRGLPPAASEDGAAARGPRLGEDAYIRIPGSPSLRDMGERLTMLLWVYPEGPLDKGPTDIFTNGDNHVLQVSGGRQLTFFAGGWGRGDCTVELPADWFGHWHLIAGVCDADGLRVYIDGSQRGFTPLEKAVHLFAGDNTWMIGRNEEFPGQRIYKGRIFRPRMYQEALPAATILTIYQKERCNP